MRREQERSGRGEISLPAGVWAGLLVVALVVSAGAYRALLPLGQGPDEESHLLFVRTLAGEPRLADAWSWGLPVFSVRPDDPNFETHQPPLYYLLAAGLYRLGGVPAAALLSLLATALLVVVTWRLSTDLAGADVGLAAAAVVAFLPMNAFLALRINNDPLVNLCWAWVLWRWIRTLRDGPSRAEGLAVGLGLAAALLTKQNSIVLLPLAAVVLVLSGRLSGRWSAAAEQTAISLAVAGLLAGWWYLRNQVIYGDLFAQEAFNLRFADRPTPATLAAQFAHQPDWRYWPYVFEWVVRTSVIYIGHHQFRLPWAVYPYHLAILAVGLVSSAVALVSRARRGIDPVVAGSLLLALAALAVTALLARFNQTYFQAQGRYLLLALPAWAMALTGGPSRLFPPGSAGRRYALALAPMWLFLVNLLLLTAFVPGLLDTAPEAGATMGS